MVAGHGEERESCINGEGCGNFGYFEGEDILRSWWKEGRKKKKEKEKNL